MAAYRARSGHLCGIRTAHLDLNSRYLTIIPRRLLVSLLQSVVLLYSEGISLAFYSSATRVGHISKLGELGYSR